MTDAAKLREALSKLLISGWHYFECPRTRTSAPCTCGWDAAQRQAYELLAETEEAT